MSTQDEAGRAGGERGVHVGDVRLHGQRGGEPGGGVAAAGGVASTGFAVVIVMAVTVRRQRAA